MAPRAKFADSVDLACFVTGGCMTQHTKETRRLMDSPHSGFKDKAFSRINDSEDAIFSMYTGAVTTQCAYNGFVGSSLPARLLAG